MNIIISWLEDEIKRSQEDRYPNSQYRSGWMSALRHVKANCHHAKGYLIKKNKKKMATEQVFISLSQGELKKLISDAVKEAIQINEGTGRTSPESEYLDIKAASLFLSKTPNALRVMAFKNQIDFIKKQGRLYFLKSDLIAWMESGRVEADVINVEDILIKNKGTK